MKSRILIIPICFLTFLFCIDLWPTKPQVQLVINTPSGTKAEDMIVVNEIIRLNTINKSIDSISDTYNERITILWLSRLGIDTIPPSISKLGALKILLLDSNQLSSLPNEFNKMERLERLSISKNHFSTFPSSLISIDSLKSLDLSYNQISYIPESAQQKVFIYNKISYFGPCGSSDCSTVERKNGLNLNYNNLCSIDSTMSKWIDVHYSIKSEYYPELEPWRTTQLCIMTISN